MVGVGSNDLPSGLSVGDDGTVIALQEVVDQWLRAVVIYFSLRSEEIEGVSVTVARGLDGSQFHTSRRMNDIFSG